jgi:hypothetical protein
MEKYKGSNVKKELCPMKISRVSLERDIVFSDMAKGDGWK